MLLPRLGALLLVAGAVNAFKNTSPFLLLSSEPLEQDAPLQNAQIALTKDVEDRLIESLRDCDKKWYYIFSQEQMGADDFRDGVMPKLQKHIASADKSAVVQIPEVMVMGELSAQSTKARLEEACAAKGKKSVEASPDEADEYRIITMDLPQLSTEPKARAKGVKDTDDAIADTVASVVGKENPSVFIYITTPQSLSSRHQQDSHLYEMDEPYPSALHTDLKRDLYEYKRRSDSDNDMQASLPLFEKYQFLSPAIFMGLGVSLLLFVILYVGISAIAGLEVSYMAFSKEMGPGAQKNKQQ